MPVRTVMLFYSEYAFYLEETRNLGGFGMGLKPLAGRGGLEVSVQEWGGTLHKYLRLAFHCSWFWEMAAICTVLPPL